MEENENFGFEEGMLWLPANVLDDGCDDHSKPHFGEQWRQPPRHVLKPPAAEPLPLHSKSSSKPHQRQRNLTNWAAGGPGMQAIFLDSGPRSCGTGVFLPRRAGTDFQLTNKPACSPVLLPSRVVQALNLNVHELGLQIKPQDPKHNSKGLDSNIVSNKKGKDVSSQSCVISQNRSSSPDIFLPKEWTY